MRKWRKTGTVVFSGALSLVLSLDEQRKNEIERDLNYIYSPYGLIAVIIKQGTNENLYYTFTDQLGSIISLLNPDGSVAEKYSYDAWGRRRNPLSWTYDSIPTPTIIDRGFTGHEHLDEFGLINMNGRMYDPALGRFLSVDPFIQFPESAQSYNGYGYVMNNPLKFSDPTGMLRKAYDENDSRFDAYLSSLCDRYMNFDFLMSGGGRNSSNGINNDWDKWIAAVRRGYKGTMEEFFSGVKKKIFSLEKGGPTIEVTISTNFKGQLYEKADITIKIYGSMYSEYNFVQTWNRYFEDSKQFSWTIDRGFDHNFGFHFTSQEFFELKNTGLFIGADGSFRDSPNIEYDFDAELTVCGLKGESWYSLNTFSWGYSIIEGSVYPYFKKSDNLIKEHINNVNSAIYFHNNYFKSH